MTRPRPARQKALMFIGTVLFAAGIAAAGDGKGADGKDRSFCDVFDLAKFHQGEEGAILQSLATTGRLQADAVFFHESPEREFDALLWRRYFQGLEAKFRGGFTLRGEADFDLNERDPLYRKITDAFLEWSPGKSFALRAGKQSAAFTLDGKTSSRLLIRPDRSLLSFNLWFPENFFSGVTASGKRGDWSCNAGVFSSAGGDEFGDFNGGYFSLLTVSRDLHQQIGWDKALVALDLVHNEEDPNNARTRDLANIVSIDGKFEHGKFGVWTDLAFGDGYRTQSDVFGLEIMPFYNLTKKLQLVASFNFVASEDVNGVFLDRYENVIEPGRADRVQELFGGVNYYLCEHKLKWQNGLEYTTASDSAGDGGAYHGWGYTSAVRMYW